MTKGKIYNILFLDAARIFKGDSALQSQHDNDIRTLKLTNINRKRLIYFMQLFIIGDSFFLQSRCDEINCYRKLTICILFFKRVKKKDSLEIIT